MSESTSTASGAIPVNVLTGFLGSGKTTLLQRLLQSPQMDRTAVLINEFGEIGLDHLLVQQVDEAVVLLQSGCICCSIRDDLKSALRSLLSKRERARDSGVRSRRHRNHRHCRSWLRFSTRSAASLWYGITSSWRT